ncbi:MAG TPA: hypothetical protein PLK12_11090 [Prolixibacteraceae bacterium]|nr:hypothetical protein [Prolixibacteraceae bacterium]
MEEKILSEKESLQLISKMIQNTQKNLENSDGRPFLIWGYTTVFVSLLVYFTVSQTGDHRFNYFWFLIPLLGVLAMLFTRSKGDKERYVKTFLGNIILNIWVVVGIAALFVSVGSFFVNIPVLGLMLLLMGMGTLLTGLTIRYKLIVVSGAVGMLLSALPFLIHRMEQILVFAVVFVIMMIVPGHVLRYQNRKSHV